MLGEFFLQVLNLSCTLKSSYIQGKVRAFIFEFILHLPFKTLLYLNIKTKTIASSEHIMVTVLHSFTTVYKMPAVSVIHWPH